MSEEFQRLSEGYDFIEEACGYSEPLTFTEAEETVIVESENRNSTFKILGRCVGQFQPCGEFSRNQRLYEQDHWNHILENTQFQDRINSRDLLGTIGHHDKRVDDSDIAAGIVSHIVTKLEIHEDANGTPFLYGELEILDTPAGRNLKALYEGGANLYVSSRGAGKLLPVANESYKLVDKNSYFCETFDVVRRPGFLKAKPMFEQVTNEAVKESIKESVNECCTEETETASLKSQIDKLTKIIEKVVDDVYKVDEATNMEKVFDLDNKINNVEKIRKQEQDNLAKAEGKPWAEVKKSQDRVSQADNLLKRLNKSRKEALGEAQAGILSTIALLSKSDISEEVLSEVLDLIKGGLQ